MRGRVGISRLARKAKIALARASKLAAKNLSGKSEWYGGCSRYSCFLSKVI
jgi:hypothetical protein